MKKGAEAPDSLIYAGAKRLLERVLAAKREHAAQWIMETVIVSARLEP